MPTPLVIEGDLEVWPDATISPIIDNHWLNYIIRLSPNLESKEHLPVDGEMPDAKYYGKVRITIEQL